VEETQRRIPLKDRKGSMSKAASQRKNHLGKNIKQEIPIIMEAYQEHLDLELALSDQMEIEYLKLKLCS